MASSVEWFSLNRIVFYELDGVLSNKSILCDKELFQTTLILLGEQRLLYIQMRNLDYEL